MKFSLFTAILSTLFLIYLGNLFYLIWEMVQPPLCTNKGLCLESYLLPEPVLEVNIFISPQIKPQGSEVLHVKSFHLQNYNVSYKSTMNVKIPKSTKQNGTLYAHVFLGKVQETTDSKHKWTRLIIDSETVYQLIPMSIYKEPEQNVKLLLGSNNIKNVRKAVTHVKTVLPISILTEPLHLSQAHIPNDIHQYIRLHKNDNQKYLPIFLHNYLLDRSLDAIKVDNNTSYVPILLFYEPLSYARLRILTQTQLAVDTMLELGFKINNIDEIKAIFDTNYYLLLVLISVAFIHIFFDILIIKNDISFWKSRKSMVGLSSRLVLWRAFCHIVVFLYLVEEKVTLLVIVPIMIRTIIEIWKVFKIIPVDWKNLKFKQLNLNCAERDTRKFEAEFMEYISYILYPLCIVIAIYLFIYEPQKSWYLWIIKSLVHGTYLFGFWFMLPQLFINYKLKSVTHLSWKTLMFKAFNTFIDDVFAFITPMPTSYRVARFRDDIVFIFYIYQRWLYPVDNSRVDAEVEIPEPPPEEARIKID